MKRFQREWDTIKAIPIVLGIVFLTSCLIMISYLGKDRE
jgi:hypothetical protein